MATNIGALGHDSDAVQDNVYGLLAISGNATDSTDNTAYLCGGCHGNAPGTGSSHPTQPGTAGLSDDVASTDVQNSITGTQGSLAKGWATLNDANKVNCESCHRPHNATFGTGALILEANDNTLPASDKPAFQLMADNTAGSQLNQEGLCERCHLQGQ
jgi:cytochrome c553